MVGFFGDLFTSTGPSNFDGLVDQIPRKATEEMRVGLRRPYTIDEVLTTLNQMNLGKAPTLDCMNPFFDQNFFSIIGKM